jgi:hypothetical protein
MKCTAGYIRQGKKGNADIYRELNALFVWDHLENYRQHTYILLYN